MSARQMALGGVTAALAVVVLCLGGLVPLATYILPMICCILLQLITDGLGRKGSWVWYSAVSILCLLLSPDKESAAVFLFLGYYPLIKPKMDGFPLTILWKLLYFNAATFMMYVFLIYALGLSALMTEFAAMGFWLGLLTLALGNLCFLLLDKVLAIFSRRFGGKRI